MLAELIKTLSDAERASLEERIAHHDTRLHRFIAAHIAKPDSTKAELCRKFRINENTYLKNLSLAKDEIYDIIRQHMQTGYDHLMLPNLLYKRGLEVHASKLRIKLEKEYEQQGWWIQLNELYNLELIVAYAKCDLDWLKKIIEKIVANSKRLSTYLVLDKEVVYEMAVLEKGILKESQFSTTEKRLKSLLTKAQKLQHPVPIFNLLHCSLLFYTKFCFYPNKAKKIIQNIETWVLKAESLNMSFISKVARLNLLTFYTEFETGRPPQLLFELIDNDRNQSNMLYNQQAILTLCIYYFMQRDEANFIKYKTQMEQLPADKNFKYQTKLLQALQSYLQKDSKAFYRYQNEFYNQVANREYNSYNLLLRYLEILLLLHAKETPLACSKWDATAKFLHRNFSKARIAQEKIHLHLLKQRIKSKSCQIAVAQPIYRLTRFLETEVST